VATRNLSRPSVAIERPSASVRPGRPGIPALLLALAVVLALLAAYSNRPFVAVDVGARDDYIFINGFHAREFTSAKPEQRFEWPAGSDTLTIREPLSDSFRMVTFTLDPFTPAGTIQRRLVAVYANEIQLTTVTDRGGNNRQFRVLIPPDMDLSQGVALRLESLPDKTSEIPPIQALSAQFSAARTYRWTDGNGTIRLPALGRGIWRAELQTVVVHPDGQPVNARLVANGTTIATLPDYNDSRRLSFLLPETVVGDGDLTLAVESDVFRDPRPLGVLIERVAVTPVGGGANTSLPPFSALLPALVITLAAYGTLRWLTTPTWLAWGLAAVVVLLGAWAIGNYRLSMGHYLAPLALLMLFTAAITPPTEWLIDRGFRRLGIPLDPWLRRSLMAIFIIGLWLKAGGMVFPYMRSIDISWHMDRVRWILDGNLAAIYLPGAFSESVMPIDEWGPNRPVIPYSPFFHIFSTVFSLIPWWPMELSANLFSAFLDTSRTFMIAVLTLKSGLSKRMTLLATLIYAITPFTFLLHSWGNVPTTFGMWWTLLATTIIVALYPKLEKPGPLALLTFVTLSAMLIYTVMAVFHVMFIITFLIILRIRPALVDHKPARAVLIALAAGIGLSVAIYYGQYIGPIVERTIPYMASLATQGPESVGVEREPLGTYLARYIPHLDYHIWPGDFLYYGVAIPAILAIPGFFAFRKKPVIYAILAAWYTIAILFLFAGYRISMVDKQLFYVFPAISLCWAVVADRFWQRGWWSRVMLVVFYAFTLFSAVDLWIIRIIRSPIEG
jgi:hypothetical protein